MKRKSKRRQSKISSPQNGNGRNRVKKYPIYQFCEKGYILELVPKKKSRKETLPKRKKGSKKKSKKNTRKGREKSPELP